MRGVVIKPWRQLSQYCLALLALRRPRWQILCSFLTTPYSGISTLLDSCMIKRWRWSRHSLICCTLLGGENKICWILSKRQMYVVSSFYHAFSPPAGSPFPWKSIWRNKAPSRVAFFIWKTTFEKILTLNNMRKSHIIVMNWCFMCKKSGKSIDHLLLHCEIVKT